MEDRFKSKLWLVKSKEWIDEYFLDQNGQYWIIDDHGAMLPSPFAQDVKIVFCTGLKDKNGKLVFEGDILRNDWNEGICEIRDVRSVDWLLSDGFLAGMDGDALCAEILGNIYETPELLK